MVEAASIRLAEKSISMVLTPGEQSQVHGASGFIIRDYTGDPVLAGAGICHIVLEMNSWQLEDAIRTSSRDMAPSRMILRGIRELLHHDRFWLFVPRACIKKL
jgi:hypothetical protein